MKYNNLSGTGLMVSELSLGTWVNFGEGDSRDILKTVEAALDVGVNFFDTAEVYRDGQAETLLGNMLNSLAVDRTSIAVATKVYWGGTAPLQVGLSRKRIHDGCNNSLKRLGLDYIDVFYCHRFDEKTPISEVVIGMDNLVKQGKIIYWGTSEWSPDQIVLAKSFAEENGLTPPIVEQPEYNLLIGREQSKKISRMKRLDVSMVTYSPLSSGTLTGKYANGIQENSRFAKKEFEWVRDAWLADDNGEAKHKKIAMIKKIADQNGIAMNHLALLWCLSNEKVQSVLIGASNPEQFKDNARVINMKDRMTPDIINKLDDIMWN